MEFFLELFFAAVFSLALAFLFAKLISGVSSADNEQEEIRLGSRKEEREIFEFDDGGVVVEERRFEDEVRNLVLEMERRVEFIVGGEVEKVEKFEGESVLEGSEIVHGEEEIGKEVCESVDFRAIREEEEKEEEEVKIVGLDDKSMDGRSTVKDNETLSCVLEERLVGEKEDKVEVIEIGIELAEQEQIVSKDDKVEEFEIGGEKGRVDGEMKEGGLFSDDDDDWEGIERSEIEKVFASASAFVASSKNDDRLSKLGSDVEMQLYGFHKVATEGPCHESPPIALMMSARAKWNAWQRLGNMSPEVAMEQYITLLSDGIPGWMGENPEGDGKQGKNNDSPEAVEFGTRACDLSSSLQHQPENERKPEVESLAEGHDALGGV